MQTIQDAGQVAAMVQKYHIDEYFSEKNVLFQLRQYEKGEFLCSPLKPLEDFLFLVSGSVHLYDLQQNGGKRSIQIASGITLFGDMEFATGRPSIFFAEATGNAICLALPMRKYADKLRLDAKFLGYVVHSQAEKLAMVANLEFSNTGLEEKVLYYLSSQDGMPEISGVGNTAIRLHCSRRQLQRVLKKLCEDGRLSKAGKGKYILC